MLCLKEARDYGSDFINAFSTAFIDAVQEYSKGFEVDFEEGFGDLIDDLDMAVNYLKSDFFKDFNVYFNCGAEKIVAIPTDSEKDFVIKIAFSGGHKSEPEVYKEAQEKDLADYFLPSFEGGKFILDGEEFSWYIQEKVKTNAIDRNKKATICSIEPDNIMCSDRYNKLSNNWSNSYSLYAALSTIGWSDGQKLLSFLKRNDINDFHSGNWVVLNGTIKLMDYSGYDNGEEI